MMIDDVNTFLWSIEIPLQKRTPPTPHLSLKDKQGFPFAWRGLEPGDREKQWNLHPVLMITGSDSLPLVVSIIVNVDTFAFAIVFTIPVLIYTLLIILATTLMATILLATTLMATMFSGLIYCAGQAMLVYRSCRCCRRIWNKVFRALPSKSS